MTADVAKLRLEADSSQVRTSSKDLDDFARSAKSTGKQTNAITLQFKKLALGAAALGGAIGKQANAIASQFKELSLDTAALGDAIGKQANATASRFKTLALSATALGGAMGLANGAIIKSSAQAAQELTNLSRVAGVGVVDFQKYAFASRTVGVEQDKLADILKDVNDKIGDFMQTGAGPMADFFEKIAPKVGVTADQFRNLNSRDALQLYVDSLEKANVSQADMTFYMEAIASDATLLLPLLQNNGKAMSELAEKSDELGLALSEIDIRNLRDANVQLQQTTAVLRSMGMVFAAEMAPYIQSVTESLTESFANSTGSMESGLRSAATTSAMVFADILDYAASLVGFVEKNPDLVQYGIIGYMIFGKKGALIGAAIGSTFNGITDQLEALGLKASDIANPVVAEIAKIDTQLAQLQRNIDSASMTGWDNNPGLDNLIEQASMLQLRRAELTAQIKDDAEAQEIYNQEIDKSVSGGSALSETLSVMAEAMRRTAKERDNLLDSGSDSPFSFESPDPVGFSPLRLDDSGSTEGIDGLIKDIQTERQALEGWYQEKQNIIFNARDEELAIIGGRNAAFEALESEHQKRLTEIVESEEQQRMSIRQSITDMQMQATGQFMNSMTGLIEAAYGEQSEAARIAFIAQQAFQGASAIMSAEVAAANTLAAYSALAAVSGPAAPAVLAKGAMMSNITRAMGYASAAAIFATNTIGQRAMGGQVQAGGQYLVGERGPEIITMGASGSVTPSHRTQKSGDTIVIQVDARGTDESAVEAAIIRAAPALITAASQQVRQLMTSGGKMSQAARLRG